MQETVGMLEKYARESDCGLVRLSEVEPHWPEFLWEPYLRRGNLNLLNGNGGSGKTTLGMAITEAITRGRQPEGMPGRLDVDRPRNVIYLGSEDEAPVYRAMLDAQGADTRYVFMPEEGHMPLLTEWDRLLDMIRRFEAALLIVDPIQALLPPQVDMNKSNEVRPVMDGLRSVCRETGCTALLLGHLNKQTKASNIYRGSGSMDFANASRSVLMTGWTADGQRAAGHLKGNGAALVGAILFDIVSEGRGARLVWKGSDENISGDDILPTRSGGIRTGTKEDPHVTLIRRLAETGPWSGTTQQAILKSAELGVNYSLLTAQGFGRAANREIPGVVCKSKRKSSGTFYSIYPEGMGWGSAQQKG